MEGSVWTFVGNFMLLIACLFLLLMIVGLISFNAKSANVDSVIVIRK